MISYGPFGDTLGKKKISTYALRETHRISPHTLTRMRQNRYLSLRTIDDLCRILDCRIQDIVEYKNEA